LKRELDPDGLVDFRTPSFDLDNVYGRGPADQPYMYDGKKFRLGEVCTGGGVPDSHDLPRFAGRAIIGDPRNDENSIVSQLQGLLHRFHNRMVDDNPDLEFDEVQQRVRFHYQYVVLNDFLPRIVAAEVLDALKDGEHRWSRSRLEFFHWRNDPYMPVEFSVAAYRFGHSMVRPGYRLNDTEEMLLPIFPAPGAGPAAGLTGFSRLPQGRAIDWGRFVDIDIRDYGGDGLDDANHRRLQLAYRIDTSLVSPLATLPPAVASDPPASLASRNLLRGWRLGLPSGQAVAQAMGLTPMTDDQIVIGKAVDEQDPGVIPTPIVDVAGGVFADNCPLWVYVLAEAAAHRVPVPIPASGGPATVATPKLGPVGGRIVAEVFVGLLFGDKSSMLTLDPTFTPVSGPGFALKDLVTYALGQGPALH
jgi:hypothetical protein